MPEEPVFDRRGLLERLLGDERLAQAVISGFLSEMPGRVAELAEAVGRSDLRSAGALVHQLKGAAAAVGGASLCACAAELEVALRAGSGGPLSVASLLTRLVARFAALEKCLAGEAWTPPDKPPTRKASDEDLGRRR